MKHGKAKAANLNLRRVKSVSKGFFEWFSVHIIGTIKGFIGIFGLCLAVLIHNIKNW